MLGLTSGHMAVQCTELIFGLNVEGGSGVTEGIVFIQLLLPFIHLCNTAFLKQRLVQILQQAFRHQLGRLVSTA